MTLLLLGYKAKRIEGIQKHNTAVVILDRTPRWLPCGVNRFCSYRSPDSW